MATRISISGMPRSARTLIANALSQLTGLPFIQGRTMYERQKMFDLCTDNGLSWKDVFFISSSSLIERIEMEGKVAKFVSDGAVFTELMYLKFTENFNKEKPRSEKDRILMSLENVCFNHAVRHYDLVVHIEAPTQFKALGETEFFKNVFDIRKVPYLIYTSDPAEKTLEGIISYLNIPTKMTVDNALYIAKNNLYISTL